MGAFPSGGSRPGVPSPTVVNSGVDYSNPSNLSVFPEIRAQQLAAQKDKEAQAQRADESAIFDYAPRDRGYSDLVNQIRGQSQTQQASDYARPGRYQGSPEPIDTSGMPYGARPTATQPSDTTRPRRFAGQRQPVNPAASTTGAYSQPPAVSPRPAAPPARRAFSSPNDDRGFVHQGPAAPQPQRQTGRIY